MPNSLDDGSLQFIPHSITDRGYWDGVRVAPQHVELVSYVEDLASQAPVQPPLPLATDFLAARRSNDRGRLDRHWQRDRTILSALALRRCLLGPDAEDQDDRLLDWVWSFLTEATWVVSAHLPGNDLPASGKPTLDLASCEMAALFAEMREALQPWMASVSNTLADSVIAEIDERVLTPYGAGEPVGWQGDPAHANNWLGVCAGSILAACESLAAQGQPRPEARARALDGLRQFIETAFTEHGECDEGLGYWVYGVGFAVLGWSRLSRQELEANVDMARLRLIADYPRRIHLFDNYFFSGNDASLRVAAPRHFLPWLAAATGVDWLQSWAHQNPPATAAQQLRHLGLMLRALDANEPAASDDESGTAALLPSLDEPVRLIEDQQVGIFTIQTTHGELLACLSGGSNAERHNHNDLGHFLIALNGQWIVPDIGAPAYTADFFGPRRYTYLAASSRGHCCPVIGGVEQRAGAEAAGKIVEWAPDVDAPRLLLDLTAAYPPEAGLLRWTRSLECRQQTCEGGGTAVIADSFQTATPNTDITHLIWSLVEPELIGGHNQAVRLGLLRCEFSVPPHTLHVAAVSPEEHRLREWNGQPLYCIEAGYQTDAKGHLEIETLFRVVAP